MRRDIFLDIFLYAQSLKKVVIRCGKVYDTSTYKCALIRVT